MLLDLKKNSMPYNYFRSDVESTHDHLLIRDRKHFNYILMSVRKNSFNRCGSVILLTSLHPYLVNALSQNVYFTCVQYWRITLAYCFYVLHLRTAFCVLHGSRICTSPTETRTSFGDKIIIVTSRESFSNR